MYIKKRLIKPNKQQENISNVEDYDCSTLIFSFIVISFVGREIRKLPNQIKVSEMRRNSPIKFVKISRKHLLYSISTLVFIQPFYPTVVYSNQLMQ